jgi:hypothetical protein
MPSILYLPGPVIRSVRSLGLSLNICDFCHLSLTMTWRCRRFLISDYFLLLISLTISRLSAILKFKRHH